MLREPRRPGLRVTFGDAVAGTFAYLPPEEEQKLVHFDFKRVHLNALMTKERVIELRSQLFAPAGGTRGDPVALRGCRDVEVG